MPRGASGQQPSGGSSSTRNDDAIRDALKLLERSARPPGGMAEALFERLLVEAERPPRPSPRGVLGGAPRRRWALTAAAAIVAMIVAGSVTIVLRPPSAFAVVREAIEQFASIPPFRATIVGPTAPGLLREPGTAATLELSYRGADAWRLELIHISPPSEPANGPVGSFDLWDGERRVTFDAVTNTYRITRVVEGFSPLGFLSWEREGGIAFWEQRCGGDASLMLDDEHVAGRLDSVPSLVLLDADARVVALLTDRGISADDLEDVLEAFAEGRPPAAPRAVGVESPRCRCCLWRRSTPWEGRGEPDPIRRLLPEGARRTSRRFDRHRRIRLPSGD